MTQSEYIWDESQIEEQRAVVKIELDDGDIWYMDYDEWIKAGEEGREKPVIFGDKLILVDDETYEELEKLELWLKNNKEI
jgi:hypothetical protein